MISERQLPELRTYRKLEGLLPVESAHEFERLVVPNANDQLPVHRWFRFKEGFSADLLRVVLQSTMPDANTQVCLVDPFCGAGTSLLSAQELSVSRTILAVGIERNPFIHFVASTKVSWPLMSARKILSIGKEVLESSAQKAAEIPPLSSFTTGRCMSRYTAARLAAVRDEIRAHGSSANHSALLLGLGASIEQLSKTRKDGRALRLVRRDRQNISRVLSERWSQIAADVKFMQRLIPQAPLPAVLLGDGRRPELSAIPTDSVDILLTSPPYPNNIDYSEVYKLELWLLGFMSNSEDFLSLRKTTFRSHPTAATTDLSEEFVAELKSGKLKTVLRPIISRTKLSPEHYRHRLILGYAFDLWSTLREHHKVLKQRGICVLVVGNSLHGGNHLPYLIPTDLMLSALAERAGFRVKKIAIARNFKRRLPGNHFLRESLVTLEKE
jgi:hypothetical protein